MRKLEHFTFDVNLTKRGFFVLLIPYLTVSSWFYSFDFLLNKFVISTWAQPLFAFSIVLALILGPFILKKTPRLYLLYTWAFFATIASFLLMLTSISVHFLMLISVLGFVFGLGLLSYLTWFCSLTTVMDRGRVGGTIVFVTLMVFHIFLSFVSSLSLFEGLITCSLFSVSTLVIIGLKPHETRKLTYRPYDISFNSHGLRAFIFYAIPWIAFCLINSTFSKIPMSIYALEFSEVLQYSIVLQYISACLGAFIAGVLCDRVGRRITLSMGLVSYGTAAAVSFFVNVSKPIILTHFATTGFSWGVFLVVYYLVLWGDLASKNNRGILYAVGLTPFYLSTGLGYVIFPIVSQVPPSIAAPVSSIIIFLCNVPLLLAPEVLPQKSSKAQIKWYMVAVKKWLEDEKKRASKE